MSIIKNNNIQYKQSNIGHSMLLLLLYEFRIDK
jgi:hypothetical protein